MSSIDTYSTTKDLVFDKWVSSHRSDEIRFDVYSDEHFFMCSLKYEDIWKWFYCKPKCTLEESLTIVENDKDIEKMFEVDVFFESDDEVTSIYRGHEKAKNDASTMSFEEIVAWEKEELQSPSYLRSPNVWKSNSMGIGKGKVILDDFEIVVNSKDKVVLDYTKD
nr:transposase, MuDR, MULE transposase domain protein [Tanacetum cinerariifolium]GEW33264.1 transposase, MuDR, MULE transposase domain protein [Tanacetum cinerariifolium]